MISMDFPARRKSPICWTSVLRIIEMAASSRSRFESRTSLETPLAARIDNEEATVARERAEGEIRGSVLQRTPCELLLELLLLLSWRWNTSMQHFEVENKVGHLFWRSNEGIDCEKCNSRIHVKLGLHISGDHPATDKLQIPDIYH